ncbi:PepSY domain-containing protein [Roseisalinus antarcticus]|uniref:PepSY domain-containing protein n=1 Tax=Roseisalinus antarcticus TaxID=254357 RepID=A0A1Y5RJY3_9RHOB|nr:PepSY domain-containing protein [Roseisalinus antarcticus]SLN16488.1 hypothetical protein ROA7023_00294 [Roseisalinus antarcticus]
MIRKFSLATAVLVALSGSAALASGGALDDATKEQIRTTLTEQGYEVRSIGMEDGEIEVYAIKDGERLELYLDEALNIVRGQPED